MSGGSNPPVPATNSGTYGFGCRCFFFVWWRFGGRRCRCLLHYFFHGIKRSSLLQYIFFSSPGTTTPPHNKILHPYPSSQQHSSLFHANSHWLRKRAWIDGSGSKSLFREWTYQTSSSEERTFSVADIQDQHRYKFKPYRFSGKFIITQKPEKVIAYSKAECRIIASIMFSSPRQRSGSRLLLID